MGDIGGVVAGCIHFVPLLTLTPSHTYPSIYFVASPSYTHPQNILNGDIVESEDYVWATLELYLDIVNLFVGCLYCIGECAEGD